MLRPGAVFAGTDGPWSRRMKWLHVHDTLVPIDPDTFGVRLGKAASPLPGPPPGVG